MKRSDPLKPLPRWRQRALEVRARYRRWASERSVRRAQNVNARRRRLASFKRAGRRALTLAISVVGATLVSFGVWQISHPGGAITAGVLTWVVQWNYGNGRGEE